MGIRPDEWREAYSNAVLTYALNGDCRSLLMINDEIAEYFYREYPDPEWLEIILSINDLIREVLWRAPSIMAPIPRVTVPDVPVYGGRAITLREKKNA